MSNSNLQCLTPAAFSIAVGNGGTNRTSEQLNMVLKK